MCFAARNLSMPDLENRLIELHSPDSRNTLILRCKDTATAHSWFVAIHTNIMALLPQVLAELNAMLGATSTAGGSKEVKHIAWLAEQAKLDGGRQQWRPVLMAVTEKDLLLYDCMPWTRDAWASPCHSYPLVATRDNGGSSSILYRYPFERLKMSADDGIRNLYLDFGGPEGELVLPCTLALDDLTLPHTPTSDTSSATHECYL
ncbi:Beta-2-syntrophin [Cricetulus griseus]|uniref:Beta-2-syntrophin n=1 Tax=Cricetulus griseus TaxID=10029 RepID=G3HKU3_CRIGR|nr:Beta-2-syntrophin [Cricetulus griseus]